MLPCPFAPNNSNVCTTAAIYHFDISASPYWGGTTSERKDVAPDIQVAVCTERARNGHVVPHADCAIAWDLQRGGVHLALTQQIAWQHLERGVVVREKGIATYMQAFTGAARANPDIAAALESYDLIAVRRVQK